MKSHNTLSLVQQPLQLYIVSLCRAIVLRMIKGLLYSLDVLLHWRKVYMVHIELHSIVRSDPPVRVADQYNGSRIRKGKDKTT